MGPGPRHGTLAPEPGQGHGTLGPGLGGRHLSHFDNVRYGGEGGVSPRNSLRKLALSKGGGGGQRPSVIVTGVCVSLPSAVVQFFQ